MKLAIVGAGNVGGGLARAAVASGHTVTLSAADPQRAFQVAQEIGVQAAASNLDAVRSADLVVLAVPYTAVSAIAREIGDAVTGQTVVDATNPLNETMSDLLTHGTSAAEELQAQMPGAAVVKAFNTIFASRHKEPSEAGTPLDAFIAGDDAEAKSKVAEFARSLGYRVVDAGGLRMARSLEEMAFLNIALNVRDGLTWQSAWKLVGPLGSQR